MMKYLVVLLGVVAFAGGYQAVAADKKADAAHAAQEAAKPAPFKELTAEELKQMKAEQKDLVVIDSRGGKDFGGTVIAGAVNIPADQTTPETLAAAAPSKDAPLVFYCQNTACHASDIGAYKAAEAGYTKLYHYKGGIEEWQQKGFETAKIEAAAPAAEPAAGADKNAEPKEEKAN